MKRNLEKLIYHPLFSGSAVMIVGTNFVNFLNYIYHLLMGRLLGPANYSELAAIFTLIGLVALIPNSLGMVIVKFVSSSRGQEVKNLVGKLNTQAFRVSIFIIVPMLVFSYPITNFLRLTGPLLIFITAISLLFVFPNLVNSSSLQGLLRFREVVIGVISENLTKLLLGLLLVYLGFSVGGAVFALFLSSFVGYFVYKHFLRDINNKYLPKNIDLKPLLSYSGPVLLRTLAMGSMISTDMLLVKHFFPSYDAGIYASLSMFGKIIFFASGPIGNVMFPIISQRSAKGLNYIKVFIFSLILTSIISLVVLVFYYLFPGLAIMLLYGRQYLDAGKYLIFFGMFASLYTLSALFINFYLSLGTTKIVLFPVLAALFQILGILLFHNNLSDVVYVSILVNGILLASLLLYFIYERKKIIRDSSGLQAGKNDI